MAVISTVVTPDPTIFPFSFVEDRNSIEPRGELIFLADTAAITLSGVGDTQSLEVRCACPENFAYVLVEAHIQISGVADSCTNWDPIMRGNAANRNGTIRFQLQSQGIWTGISGSGGPEGRIWEPVIGTQTIIIPRPGSENTVSFKVSNTTLNEAAVVLACWIRFVIYDVLQIHNAGVNTPVLTR